MSKKLTKQKLKNEDIDDEYNIEDNIEDSYEDSVEDYDDDDNDDEKDDFVNERDVSGCAIDDAINDDDEYFNNVEETELPSEQGSEYVSKENRISSNRLSKYEMVRILGERIKQLTLGAKPLIKNFQTLSYDSIAE